MWNWLLKREAEREKPTKSLPIASSAPDLYRLEALDTASRSAQLGFCAADAFDGDSALSDEGRLRAALDYYMRSVLPDSPTNTIQLNRALHCYLRGAVSTPFLLTFGWYEFCGRSMLKHSRQFVQQALLTSNGLPLEELHVWLTSRAYEIVDITIPAILDPSTRMSDDRTLAFYFRSPSTHDQLTYHPTAFVDVDARIIDGQAIGSSIEPRQGVR